MNYPNTRTNDYATSAEGAEAVAQRSFNQRDRLLIAQYLAFRYIPNYDGLTDEEAAESCGLLQSCYWKRCGELRKDGLIEYTGRTRVGKAGTSRNISKLTGRGVAYAHLGLMGQP